MKLPKELREKRELNTATGKNRKCSIKSCSEKAIRSLSENKWKEYVEQANLKYRENRQHKIYLCKPHYKEANKFRKSQEKMYRKKGFLEDSQKVSPGRRYD